jgi:hypothetical protein
MQSALLSSANQGSITMDNCLMNMIRTGLIDVDTAIEAAADPDYIRQSTGGGGGGFTARPQASPAGGNAGAGSQGRPQGGGFFKR